MNPDTSLKGSYVRLLDSTDRWFYGKLTEWSRNHVAVTPANGMTRTFSTWEIGALQRRIRIRRERAEGAVRGARVAAVLGALPAGFFVSALSSYGTGLLGPVSPTAALVGFIAGAVAGAFVGAGLGSVVGALVGPLTRKKRWVDVEIEPIHPVFA